jgi:hypothetical protein
VLAPTSIVCIGTKHEYWLAPGRLLRARATAGRDGPVSGVATSPAPRRLRRGARRSGVERGVLGAGARRSPSPRTAPPNLLRRVFRARAARRESRRPRFRGGGSRAPGRASTAVRRVSDVVPSVPRPPLVGNPRSLRGAITDRRSRRRPRLRRRAGPAAVAEAARAGRARPTAPRRRPRRPRRRSSLPPPMRSTAVALCAPARRRGARRPAITVGTPLASGGGGRTVLECVVVCSTRRGSP